MTIANGTEYGVDVNGGDGGGSVSGGGSSGGSWLLSSVGWAALLLALTRAALYAAHSPSRLMSTLHSPLALFKLHLRAASECKLSRASGVECVG